MNNLFDFATSELSQDAVICWCVNWYNDKESTLYPLAVDILKLFTEFDENTDDEISIYRQLFKTDIMIYFKKSGKAVIVEDKVYSTEHDDQITKYRKKISGLPAEIKAKLGIAEVDKSKISTVYFKTGFFYDTDRLVTADRVVGGPDFLKIIGKYKDSDSVLQMYHDYLRRFLDYYDTYGQYTNTEPESFWSWNISKHQIAQYRLMREIFPEEEWNREKEEYKVYHGTNVGGRPWTEMAILCGRMGLEHHAYKVFWRIDTDSAGPYLSLRFYDDYDKNSQQEKEEHVAKYRFHRAQIEQIVQNSAPESMWKWEDIMPGKTENYKESALLHIHMKDILMDWKGQQKQFIERVRSLTEQFISRKAEIR